MKHGHRTRHRHGHVDTCNVQNIECSTSVVYPDAYQTPNTTKKLEYPYFIDTSFGSKLNWPTTKHPQNKVWKMPKYDPHPRNAPFAENDASECPNLVGTDFW